MKEYLLKIICAAMVCALTEGLSKGPGQQTRRLVCGMFLVLTVLLPLGNMRLPRLDLQSLQENARSAVAEGEEQAESARMQCISNACEAYIWNKAAAMDLELTVRVELDGEGFPVRVELSGPAGPLARQELTDTVVRDLGVEEGDVIWTEFHQSSA